MHQRQRFQLFIWVLNSYSKFYFTRTLPVEVTKCFSQERSLQFENHYIEEIEGSFKFKISISILFV